MRIEKINDKQIRCTLNQKDLQDREIGISEIAYGTAKAKALFRDMMQQASYEFGFDVDDIPLMIEAIPLLPEALVLVITKVEEPDELDTRFSCFTEEGEWETMDEEFDSYEDEDSYEEDDDDEFVYMGSQEEVIPREKLWEENPLINMAKETGKETDFISLPEVLGMEPRPKEPEKKTHRDIIVIFSFPNLDVVTQLAYHIHPYYHGENILYKNITDGTFYLLMHRSDHTPEEFNRICHILHEYGNAIKNTPSAALYYEEHYQCFIAKDAISVLANL